MDLHLHLTQILISCFFSWKIYRDLPRIQIYFFSLQKYHHVLCFYKLLPQLLAYKFLLQKKLTIRIQVLELTYLITTACNPLHLFHAIPFLSLRIPVLFHLFSFNFLPCTFLHVHLLIIHDTQVPIFIFPLLLVAILLD